MTAPPARPVPVGRPAWIEGHWLPVGLADRRALALYLRHYSSAKNRRQRVGAVGNAARFVGPGEGMVLLTLDCDAVFAWRRELFRQDGQEGINCTIFRNEGRVLSSALVAEADELAFARWPGERHFTFVDPGKTARRRSKTNPPGWCFRQAGWRECGTSASGLVILERLPEAAEVAA